MKVKKFTLLVTSYALLVTALCGCATAPNKTGLTTFNIAGARYLPLVALCQSSGVEWEYDTFTRTINLTKDFHKINFSVGDRLVLIDSNPAYLKHPVDIYQGTVVVPFGFKEQVIDPLSKGTGPSEKSVRAASKIKKIVIDAGHGGKDPGAIGKTGLREKVVNLDIAKRLAGILKAGGFSVTMTRSTDAFVSLERRVEIANKAKADLFVSVHSNANRVRSLQGFEVYYISANANDYHRALSAAEEMGPDLAGSYCLNPASLELKAILWDMICADNRSESVRLSSSICRIVNSDLDTRIRGIKGANFYVLKGTRMPAVLVEIGYLTNRKEERMIRNSYYRQQIAEALAKGIENYSSDNALMQARKPR